MSSSWKPTAFVLMVSLTPALAVLAIFLSGRLSLVWGSLTGIYYVWLLPNYTWKFFTSPLRNLPQPSGVSFLIGHDSSFSRPPGARFLRWMQATPNSGLIFFRGFFHHHEILLITSPEGLKEVMNDKCYDYEKPVPPKRFLSWIVGEGLLISEGPEHKAQRKAVTPAFHGNHLKALIPLFWRKSVQFTEVLSALLSSTANGSGRQREGVVEENALTARATLDIIGLAGLGQDFNCLEHDEDGLAKHFAILTDTENSSMVVFFVAHMLLPAWLVRILLWKMNGIFADTTAALQRSSNNLVQEKKVAMADQGASQVDILSILMRSPVSDELLVNQLRTFLAAGSETTSSALTWVLYLLAIHPAAQSKLRASLQAQLILPTSDNLSDPSAIERVPLLHGVCNETLRLYPTVPVTSRIPMRPTSILGNPIPRGTLVILAPWAINRLPALWGADAGEFRPERWVGEDGAPLTGGATAGPYSFITFLHGPRSCIGQGFARLELKCLVAATVLRFHVEMADEKEVPFPAGAFTIKPKNGLRLRLREL